MTQSMPARRTKTAVHNLSEGGFLVRGETDPFKAMLLIMDDNESSWPIDDVIAGLEPGYQQTDYLGPKCEPMKREPTAEEIETWKATAAHYFARLLNPANWRCGWMRISPCPGSCGEHGWHYDEGPTGPGRGNFQGVIFE
ncbi:MAG: hypothetical protein M3536_10945 [Actinomycetota bacterium]|nr:hypothetical protein [Actinomycetota bacterium]